MNVFHSSSNSKLQCKLFNSSEHANYFSWWPSVKSNKFFNILTLSLFTLLCFEDINEKKNLEIKDKHVQRFYFFCTIKVN